MVPSSECQAGETQRILIMAVVNSCDTVSMVAK